MESHFILLRLLRDGQPALAKSMTDSFLYEVRHYGKVLNANRTYYLTRSQPPFLTRMVLDVYRSTGEAKWLEQTLPELQRYYRFWTTESHLTPQTGLSRYDGGSDQPAPEEVFGERDESNTNHYERVREYYRIHDVKEYNLADFYNRQTDQLTPPYYRGDRAMRESGFDPSARFGPFSVGIVNHNSVELNSLLDRMELDMTVIYGLLDQLRAAEIWSQRATTRASTIHRLMWDPKAGLFDDYNFVGQDYPFLTTFDPLWAGLAIPMEATTVAANLPLFEKDGGLQTSARVSGNVELTLPRFEVNVPAKLPEPGSPTMLPKILSQSGNGFEIEGLGGSITELDVRFVEAPGQIAGGALDGTKLHVRFPTGEGYRKTTVRFTW